MAKLAIAFNIYFYTYTFWITVVALNTEAHAHQSISPLFYDKASAYKGNILGVELSIPDRQKTSKKLTLKDDSFLNQIQPTKTLNADNKVENMSDLENDIALSKYAHFVIDRDARFLSNDSTEKLPKDKTSGAASMVQPTPVSLQSTSSSTAMATNGRQYPNPDIQDIITGIVKLLNGNVNVHAATHPQFQTTRKVYASRINNRGPPRITDLPDYSPTTLEQEHEIPQKVSTPVNNKPSGVPYPFDMPMPTNPIRYTGVQLPDIIANNNKPSFVTHQQNRPPWQRHRPRPPIITNTNRLGMQTPPTFKLPPRPVQDHRPPSKDHNTSPNPLPTDRIKYQQTSLINTTEPSYIVEKYENLESEPTTEITTLKGETSKKVEKPKKPNKAIVESVKESETNMVETLIQPHTSQTTTIPAPSLSLNDEILNIIFSSESSTDTSFLASTTTPELPQLASIITSSDSVMPISKTSSTEIEPTKNVIAPSTPIITSSIQNSTSSPTYHARPGIVLDDTEFNKSLKTAAPTKVLKEHHQTEPIKSVSSLLTMSNVYGEIFDVTLSAIQGPGHKGGSVQTTYINPQYIRYGADGNDIIVSASGEDSFVSIDGKRTYINLFGEAVETAGHPKLPSINKTNTAAIQPTKTTPNSVTTNLVSSDKGTEKPATTHEPHQKQSTQQQNMFLESFSGRPNYRKKTQQAPVRIDTCIVGDDSTCDLAQNEMCKTDYGVSSCHCRPGYSRRKYREPCRKVLSLQMSLRVDKYQDKRIVWDKVFADNTSKQFEYLSYEAVRALDSAMSMTPFSDDFINARVNNIFFGNDSASVPGVYVNLTIQMDGNVEALQKNIKADIPAQLLGVVHRRNNNIGNSLLYVESPEGSISALKDVDECSSSELNDCHPNANCTNVWGSFRCKCTQGLRDPWSDHLQRAGRECLSCSSSYCNNRGNCRYDDAGTQLMCECTGNYYGSQCEIDGDVLVVAIGASVIAVVIITLTLICLVMWSKRWHQEQKETIESSAFSYINRANLSKLKSFQANPYQVALEDRMRWAQIADVMSHQSNHYAIEPVLPQRAPSAMYGYPNLQQLGTLTSLSMAGTMPVHQQLPPIPAPRMGTIPANVRRLDNSSSSEEEDRADLLGRSYQSGIYYDVDYEPSDQLYDTSSKVTKECNSNGTNKYSSSNTQGIPMSTYTANRMPMTYHLK